MKLNTTIITSMARLGAWFREEPEVNFTPYRTLIPKVLVENKWFTEENLKLCFTTWGNLLTLEQIEKWLIPYSDPKTSKKIGLIMAGNIPLVGLHDLISVLVCGHHALVKTSSKDQLLMKTVIAFLQNENKLFQDKIQLIDGPLQDFDAAIATGNNNSSRYFEQYFRQIPHIIRKNRHSVAILRGHESRQALEALAQDIFAYFGLGCRNVSKLYVPKNYDFKDFFEAIYPYHNIIEHSAYANNYDYNKAVYLMTNAKMLDNGFLLLKEDQGLGAPVGCLFYETYTDELRLSKTLGHSEEVQCVVGNDHDDKIIPFGQTQSPNLSAYADGVDTISFLTSL